MRTYFRDGFAIGRCGQLGHIRGAPICSYSGLRECVEERAEFCRQGNDSGDCRGAGFWCNYEQPEMRASACVLCDITPLSVTAHTVINNGSCI
jgi:hypothetical protein